MAGEHQTYARRVKDEGDMVGHVAYALYKRDKLNFVATIRMDWQREPSADELSGFIVSANLPPRMDAYRFEAEQALQMFSHEVLEESFQHVQGGFDRRLADELSKARSLPRAVVEALLANLLAVAVVALVAVLLHGTRIGFASMAADVFGYDVVPRHEVPGK